MPRLTDRSSITLVGEDNPYGSAPAFALYPAPDGCSGHRLCCLILGMRRTDYLRAFERVNLCDEAWSIAAARTRAARLMNDGGGLVLLGSKVAGAFHLPFRPGEVSRGVAGGWSALVLPHPSGRNLMWNRVGAIAEARSKVALFAPELIKLIGRGDREYAEAQ